MIGILLKAGLCNQLFMLFAGISYAIDNKIDYFIYPLKTIAKEYWNTLLEPLQKHLKEEKDINELTIYNEPFFHYKKIDYENNDIYINGFFQSDKYFKHNYQEIKNILNIDKYKNNILNKYKNINKSIAIHFRIGDYYGLQYNHPILQPSYYINALTYLKNSLKDDFENYKIFIFCQKCDNSIVNYYLNIILNEITISNLVKVNDTLEDYEQLILMSLCDHFIIANSTFSWWGAYLCENEKKQVLYPSLWFGEGLKNNNTNDLCPNEWIKINI